MENMTDIHLLNTYRYQLRKLEQCYTNGNYEAFERNEKTFYAIKKEMDNRNLALSPDDKQHLEIEDNIDGLAYVVDTVLSDDDAYDDYSY